MKITFGMCTYNRKELLTAAAESLKNTDGFERISLRIYDDCSTEYDEAYLRKLFPDAASIVRHETNIGPDRNTAYMYDDFAESGDDWFFNADSDLLYRRDALKFIEQCADEGMSFFSLFNTPVHVSSGRLNERFILKKNVGAAGFCFRRDIMEDVVKNVRDSDSMFDFHFCKFISDKYGDIPVSESSYVQHVGLGGANQHVGFDYGANFEVDSEINARIIEKTFEQYAVSSRNEIEALRYALKMREFRYLVRRPFWKLRKIIGK